MPDKITFVVATQRHKGVLGNVFTPKINSHVATVTYAKRRANSAQRKTTFWEEKFTTTFDVRASSSRIESQHDVKHQKAGDDEKQCGVCSVSVVNSYVECAHNLNRLSLYMPGVGTLDPFIRLPVALSAKDKDLLHYFLNEGRLFLPGASLNPDHCVALKTARIWLQSTPLYVAARLLFVESLRCRATGAERSVTFYRRYNAVLNLARHAFTQPDTTFSLKLYATLELIWSSRATQLPDLTTHVHALSQLIEFGDGTELYPEHEKQGPTLPPSWALGVFMMIEYRITSLDTLKVTLNGTLHDLRRIQDWHDCFRYFEAQSAANSTVEQVTWAENTFEPLMTFFWQSIEAQNWTTDTSFQLMATPFCVCFNICITFAEGRISQVAACQYLKDVQDQLQRLREGWGSKTVAHVLAETRLKMAPTVDHGTEVRICRSTVNALKIFSLLSPLKKLKLTGDLFNVVRSVTRWVDDSSLISNRDQLLSIKEVEDAWFRTPS